jgi:PAS domain S-box-containing protein
VSHGGVPARNFTYSLVGSPCETVIGRELCYYPENVQQLFPTDTNLVAMGITSYMGIPLSTRDHVEPGLVALMRRGAIRRPDQAKALLQVVAARAGAELDRRRADAALKESEHRFRALIHDLDVGVVMQDADDRILISNPAAARMLGLTAEELRGATARDPRWSLIMEDGTPYTTDRLPTVVAARTRQPVQNAIVGAAHRLTSARFWMQVTANPRLADDGSLLHLLITLVDVTDRHRAEEALRSSSRRLALAISATTDAVWEWNFQTGETYYSPRWFEMFALPPDTAMTVDTWRELCHPDDLQPALDIINAAAERPYDSGYEVEFRARRGDGQWIWVLARGNVVERDAEGRPLLMAGTSTDITQRKEAEVRRRELETRLAQSHRMEALGRLAGGIAHDFNNMLTVINGYGDLLLQSEKFDASVTEMLTDIRDAGERAAALTRQLLTFSRHQVVDPDVLELNAVVTETERMLQRLIGDHIHLESSLSELSLWVRADAGQIGQVIVNLAVNARDAMPAGGTLTVSTSRVVLDASRAAAIAPDAKPGPYAMLSVTDTGTGIPEHIRELVFEPFFTTKGPGRGTGLGLTTVHGIVQQSDGMLAVSSETGIGSTFTVYLPLVGKPEHLHEPAPERSLEFRWRKTILMVEDEVAVRGVTQVMLRKMGLDVLTAADPDEAIRVASAHRGTIDVLLTDVIMPGMNGRQLAERLVALHPTLRVLYMSGYTDDEMVQKVVMNADAAYLQKPFDAQALGRKIRQALETAPPSATK